MFPAPSYPTPVRACPELGHPRVELWLKNDGLSHPLYGGSKVRKAERLILEARARGARRVLSFGAVGSHHLITLTLFARAAGLESAAILLPQPYSQHAEDTLRAALGLGLEAYPARYPACLPALLARFRRRHDYVIPPGGSNLAGARACADAVEELRVQIESGLLPVPDVIVLPLGSGGTCGGIAAGVVRGALPCRVLGVQVVAGVAPRWAARWLAGRVLAGVRSAEFSAGLARTLSFDSDQVGPGYGAASQRGMHAQNVARELSIELDQTYTAKAFASVLELLKPNSVHPLHTSQWPSLARRPLRVLYWHTLSARPLAPLLEAAPSVAALPSSLRRLLV